MSGGNLGNGNADPGCEESRRCSLNDGEKLYALHFAPRDDDDAAADAAADVDADCDGDGDDAGDDGGGDAEENDDALDADADNDADDDG